MALAVPLRRQRAGHGRRPVIHPRTVQTGAAVAAHYDDLDRFYREVWGEHVHHGYWATGRETPDEAAEALVGLLAGHLALQPGLDVLDIGCGYGATARLLAARFGVRVTGLTISAAQVRYAADRPLAGVQIHLRDFLANGFADAVFDRAYAIESSEHFADKQAFFTEAFRVLRPGATLAVCAWLAGDAPRRWHIRHLLEPICREGRLPGMGDLAEYRALAEAAGFQVMDVTDISRQVRRTWWVCLRRVAGKLCTDPGYRSYLRSAGHENRVFALTLPRLLAAYWTGAMRYCLLVMQKPDG